MRVKKFLLFLVGVSAFTAPLFIGLPLFSAEEGGAEIFMIDNFDKRIMFNLLGGKTQGYEEAGTKCVPRFTTVPKETHGGTGSSLRLDFYVTATNSFSYYWSSLIPEHSGKFDAGGVEIIEFKNFSKYDYISFWMMDPQGGVDFRVELHEDVDGDGVYIMGRDKTSSVNIASQNDIAKRGEWQKVVIPLSSFNMIDDRKHMAEIVFVFKNGHGVNKGTVYIDDLAFGAYPKNKDKGKGRLL